MCVCALVAGYWVFVTCGCVFTVDNWPLVSTGSLLLIVGGCLLCNGWLLVACCCLLVMCC